MQPIEIIDDEYDVTEVRLIPVMSGGGTNPVVIIASHMGSMDPAAVRLHAHWACKRHACMLTKTESQDRGVSVIASDN